MKKTSNFRFMFSILRFKPSVTALDNGGHLRPEWGLGVWCRLCGTTNQNRAEAMDKGIAARPHPRQHPQPYQGHGKQ
jgi:hypothetical protein